MTRSRSLNRFNRLLAKRRRKSLRADLSGIKEELSTNPKISCQANALKARSLSKEMSLDLLESELSV